MDRFDFEQRADEERRQQEVLQALMNIASHGLTKEAALLAYECGVGQVWQQHITITHRRIA